jgi:hypothetical protein
MIYQVYTHDAPTDAPIFTCENLRVAMEAAENHLAREGTHCTITATETIWSTQHAAWAAVRAAARGAA